MNVEIVIAVLIPFLGTVLGAAGVFFLHRAMNAGVRRSLNGFAAGVMVAASIWSLITPAMEQMAHWGKLAFVPALVGIWAGFLFLPLLEWRMPRLYEASQARFGKSALLVLAVALHNLPEGMAVGVVAAGWLTGDGSISAVAAPALALGIALQNIPEGAIVSVPLKSEGMNRGRAFGYGVASGVIEPVGAVATIVLAELVAPALPCLLGFAAGAMLYVVAAELIPEMNENSASPVGTFSFAAGFSLMMALDVALG